MRFGDVLADRDHSDPRQQAPLVLHAARHHRERGVSGRRRRRDPGHERVREGERRRRADRVEHVPGPPAADQPRSDRGRRVAAHAAAPEDQRVADADFVRASHSRRGGDLGAVGLPHPAQRRRLRRQDARLRSRSSASRPSIRRSRTTSSCTASRSPKSTCARSRLVGVVGADITDKLFDGHQSGRSDRSTCTASRSRSSGRSSPRGSCSASRSTDSSCCRSRRSSRCTGAGRRPRSR